MKKRISEKHLFQKLFVFALIGLTFKLMVMAQTSEGLFVNFSQTEKVKVEISAGNKLFQPAYSALVARAELALADKPYSVMQKKQVPPSGDKHDYLSLAPYWWPDSTKTNGLPYIRKDGKVNPDYSGDNVDVPARGKFISNVETLTWAYYFSGEKKYAEKAVELLKVWFINQETRMNPSLNYAQGIPGKCDGRGIGIIDWSGMYVLISSIQILDSHGFLRTQIKQPLFLWFKEYLDWLQNSKYGKEIDDSAKNNHATWFDVQVAGIALLLGENTIAQTRLEKTKFKRIATQIDPDGSQPHELARTKSLSYTVMNLRGFILLAILAEQVNVDLWNFETPDGRSILKAMNYLIPYVSKEKEWTYPQISGTKNEWGEIRHLFRIAYLKTGTLSFKTIAESGEMNKEDIRYLLYPTFNEK